MRTSFTNSKIRKNYQAFSLIELLTVVGVIGVLAAIALPNVSRVFETAQDNGYRRSAQNICQVYNSARMAGAILPDGDDLAQVIQTLSDGVSGQGALSSVTFQLGEVSSSQAEGLQRYLVWKPAQKLIHYNPDNP